MGSVEHKSLVLGCAMSLTVISAVFTANLSIKNSDRTSKADWAIRTLAFLFATLQLASVTTSNQPSYFAIISWTLLILSFCGPVVSKPASMERLMSLILFLYVPYLLLSLSFEALFYLSFVGLLRCWIELEQDGKAADKHLLQNISTINKDHRFISYLSAIFYLSFIGAFLVGSLPYLQTIYVARLCW